MLLSRACEYGIQAVLYLAVHHDVAYISIKEIAEKNNISFHLLEVVEAIDGVDILRKCVIGMPSCDDKNPCALHSKWGKIREEIYNMLSEQSIAQLIHEK
jgi:DNA-binding IscR family transcriptional regulator